MNNYSLLFYTKKSKNKSEFSTIYLRITIKGRRSEISTKQTVLTSLWCSESGSDVASHTGEKCSRKAWTGY